MSKPNEPLFSIIVPAYNVQDYLQQCVESVLNQSCQDFEIIIVDDGSADDTGKICDKYSKIKTSHVKVIHQQNSGLSVTRNVGVSAANGKYLLFLDGDDYFEPNTLDTIKSALEPQLDLLRFQAQEIFPDQRVVKYPETGFSTTPGVEAFKKLSHYHYTENAWIYAYRRSFFVEHNFQYAAGCLSEDFGLTPLVIALAKTVKAIPNICYNYRQRTGSIMHDATHTERRMQDIMYQLHQILPKIAAIPHSTSISHFLVVSSLTSATSLKRADFLQIYQTAKQANLLCYVHPPNLKSVPRALILKYLPNTFYSLYRYDTDKS